MAKKIEKVWAIEAYETEAQDDTGDYEWKRIKKAKRQLLDMDGVGTDDMTAVELFASERHARTAIKDQFGGPKDVHFKAAEPAIVTFVRE